MYRYNRYGGGTVDAIVSQSFGSSSGYVRYASGLQIVWGRVYGNNITVTFPAAFKSASTYSCSGVSEGWTGSYGNYGMGNLTASSFFLNADKAATWLYLAIGTWK